MRHIIFILAFAVILANAPRRARAAEADAAPNFDIAANCKAESAEAGELGETRDFCMKDEEEAKQQLVRQWAHFAEEDKAECIRETNIDDAPSYVELQTCIGLASDDRTRTDNGWDQKARSTEAR